MPASTGSGLSEAVTDSSANSLTLVCAVALSFAGSGSSLDAALALAVLLRTVPLATLELTLTTISNVDIASDGNVALVALTVPVPPTAGVASVKVLTPDVCEALTNVVPGGRGSLNVTSCAAKGPLLVRVIVYVRLSPALTGSASSLLATARSATGPTSVLTPPALFSSTGSFVAALALAVFWIVD